MTKKDFAKALFEKGIFVSKAESERKVDAILTEIEEVLKSGEELNFIGWGKFEVVQKAERMGRNPKTGEEVNIGERKSVKFRPGKAFLEKLNK